MQARERSDLVDYITSAIFVIHGTFIIDANSAAASMSGYTKQELTGKPFLELIDPNDQQKILNLCANSLRMYANHEDTVQSAPKKVSLQQKRGGQCPVWVSIQLADAESPAWVITIWEPSKLSQGSQDQQRLLQQVVGVQEDEQMRIARELHDQVGQSLAAINLGLYALEKSILAGQVDMGQLERLKAITNQLGIEIHQIAFNLRPPELEEKGFFNVLGDYLEEWSAQNQIQASLSCGNVDARMISPQVGFQLYRIIQEALTNIQRHAAARHVRIHLYIRPPNLMLKIEDDGQGFSLRAPAKAHRGQSMGLMNMQERAEIIGGAFSVQSEPGKGTHLNVSIPLI